MHMDATTIIIAALALLVIVLGGIVLMQRRKSEHLKTRFGPEYDRALKETGDKRKAETELYEREKRVKSFDLRPLRHSDRDRFTGEWRQIQAEFVDDPEGSIRKADILLQDVMSERGYPVENFEQVAADVSVDHPNVVQNYRRGHDIAVRHRRGEANTEDLRQAMIHYRELFDELVTDEPTGERRSLDKQEK
jgi:hypothetical protein